MHRREFIRTASAVGLAAAVGPVASDCLDPNAQEASIRPNVPYLPNVIVLLADDLGYGDLNTYGATGFQTPAINAMASQGLQLLDFYTTNPICTPTRYSLLTGRYATRAGLNRVLLPGDSAGLRPPEITIADALRNVGYNTACIGKWHLGNLPDQFPTANGFEYWYGVTQSNDVTPLAVYENSQIVIPSADKALLTQDLTNHALTFIEQHSATAFFLYFGYTAPHTPLRVAPEFVGRSSLGLYGDDVEMIDDSCGQIIRKLQSLGISDRTLVIFLSDNGPPIPNSFGASAGTLRGGKKTVYEGGVRVPCIATWPGVIPSGTSDAIVSVLDLFPTVLAAARAPVPGDRVIDGINEWPVLLGLRPALRDSAYFLWADQLVWAVRWKQWKFHLPILLEPQLYDLASDQGESYNVASFYPDVVARLTSNARALEISF